MKRKRRKLNIKASEAAKPAQPGPGQPDSYILHLRRPMPVARAIRWSPLLQESGRSGTSAADDESAYEIFVSQAALREAQEHVWETDTRTHWGFLLGALFDCPKTQRKYSVIESVLRGSGFFEEANQAAVLAAAWAAMDKERRRMGAELLGWYHSHPHLGVVVSEADAQSQLTRFEQPWHCMLVMTPAGSDRAAGFFRSTGRGLSRRHPVPFYELLEPESLRPDAKRSFLTWSNYQTDEAVVRETGEAPELDPVAEVAFVPETEAVHEAEVTREAEPEPVVEEFEPIAEEPEPVAEEPELVVEEFEPVEESEPVVEEFEPVAEEFEPVAEAPEPVVEAPELVVEEFEPVEEPEPVVEEFEPVAEEPEPVAEEPEPVAEAPEPVVEEPVPVPDREWSPAAAAASAPAAEPLLEPVGAKPRTGPRKLERLPRSRVETPDLVIPAEIESTLVPFARRANGGLIGMLAALGVLFVVVYLMNWTSEADGDQPEAVVQVESAVNPAVGRFEAHLDALDQSIVSYGERQVDFDLGRISCEGLGLGYAAADEPFVATSRDFVTSRSLITIRQRQEYDLLVVRMDDVNQHFDASGCPRPD